MTADPSLGQGEDSVDYSTLLGTVVAERYLLLDVIGYGGMGVVYRGEHVHTRRHVAVKLLLASLTSEPQAFRRFQQEAKSASLLHHPNIVSILDFGTENGQSYLVMDYLDGISLEQTVDDSGPLPLDRFAHIFVQACKALSHAHKFGIVHRDIKPSNMVLVNRPEESDVLVIVDFGLVKLVSHNGDNELTNQQLTSANTLIGSPLFMSPEQCRGLQVDNRSDIYSLGCVMYKCLTGRLPHLGDNALDTLYKQVAEAPTALSAVNPGVRIPASLEAVVMKALRKNPDERQQDMAELGKELCEALEPAVAAQSPDSAQKPQELPREIEASPTPDVVRPAKRITKKSSQTTGDVVALIGVVIVVAVIGAVIVLSLILVLHR